MSLQSILNNEAIAMLPKTQKLLARRSGWYDRVLRNICNSYKPLSEMNNAELTSFDAFNVNQIKELERSFKEQV